MRITRALAPFLALPLVLLGSAAPLVAAPDDAAGPAALAAKLDELAQPLLDGQVAVGFVVGVLHDSATLVRSYGTLERARPERIPDGKTVFEIGSVTKTFTGLLLAIAVERGEVALDDPVAKHLPAGVEVPTFFEMPVRLVDLSTHTSGLPRMPRDFSPADPMNPYADFTLERLYAGLPGLQLADEPGATYEYSNLGAGLLGNALVNAAGAIDYEALVIERVCEPLGMQDTVVTLDEDLLSRLAPPHDVDNRPNHVWDLPALAGAGAIRSTVDDMLVFVRAQVDPDATPFADAIRLSQRKHHDGRPALGLGWHFAQDGVSLWHNGQTGGYHAFVGFSPQKRFGVVVLANSAAGPIDVLGDRILQHLYGNAVHPPEVKPVAAVPQDVLERYVGTYDLDPGPSFEITVEGDALIARLAAQPSFRLYPISETSYFYRVVDARVDFEVDAEGKPEALVLHQNGLDMRFVKQP